MKFLDMRIPPPVVLGIIGALMWAVAPLGASLGVPESWRLTLAVSVALFGGGMDLFCAIAFWRAKTTVNPLSPKNSSALVTSGAYRFSRNPMYVGQALVLLGWVVYLNSFWGLLGPVVFVLYLNRFQIAPEERILTETFGEEFLAYRKRTGRWL